MIAHRLTQSLPIATQRLRIRLSQTDMNSFGEMKSWDVTNLQPDAAGTGRNGKPQASTRSSSLSPNNDVTVEANARLPRWFARNVRLVCDGPVSRSGRYRDTVRSETVTPSFNNSPWIRGAPPSSQPPLLGAGPLRTGRDSFPSSGSGPSNASFRETRFRYGNMLAMNPVVALWMKQNAVIYTRGTTRHTRNAIINAPARGPGDLGVAHRTGPALELPEKAKSPLTPKRFRHMICFAFFEVGFINGIVRI